MSAICIIPARGGSTRIPKKNIREFKGKPIIQYSIDAALEADIFDKVYVSSENLEILEKIQTMGAYPLERPKALAQNEVGTQQVMLEELKGMDCEYACCLYATNPMIESYELKLALSRLRADKYIDYIVPVAKWLKDPGRWYFGKAKAFRDGIPLTGMGTRLMSIDPHRAIDINTEEDWQKAEKMWEALQ